MKEENQQEELKRLRTENKKLKQDLYRAKVKVYENRVKGGAWAWAAQTIRDLKKEKRELESGLASLRKAASESLDGICLTGHSFDPHWRKLLNLCGREYQPYTSFKPERNKRSGSCVDLGDCEVEVYSLLEKCSCAGEGTCNWCQKICPECQGDCYDISCIYCDSTGWREGKYPE